MTEPRTLLPRQLPGLSATALLDGAIIYTASGDLSRYTSLCEALTSDGYTKADEHGLGDCRFAAFTGEDITCSVLYSPKEELIRAVCEPCINLPTRPTVTKAVCPPLLIQLKLTYIRADCGMSYVFRLSDGRFVILDGGENEYEEAERLYDTLKRYRVNDGEPTVAAWLFSHPHGDHIGVFSDFVRHHADVAIEEIVYNFDGDVICASMFAYPDFWETLRKLKNTRVHIARTGQVYTFGDAVFEVIGTGDDHCPSRLWTCNESSVVFRLTLAGHTVMLPGDAMHIAEGMLSKRYDPAYLNCEFLQVGHHGFGSADQAFLAAVDPRAVLWSCPDFWYYNVSEWECNAAIRAYQYADVLCRSGVETCVFDLSKDVTEVERFGCPTLPYTLDIASVTRVIDLGFESCTGGSSGYRGMKITLEKAPEPCVRMVSEGTTMANLLRAETIIPSRVTVHLSYAAEGERLALLVNDRKPTTLDHEFAFLDLPADGKPHDAVLVIDKDVPRAVLTIDGKTAAEKTYDEWADSSVFLYTEKVTVTLYALDAK